MRRAPTVVAAGAALALITGVALINVAPTIAPVTAVDPIPSNALELLWAVCVRHGEPECLTPEPTATATAAPTPTPSVTPSAAPSPTPSAMPTSTPPPTSTATPAATPTSDGYILIDRADLMALPTSGTSWTYLKSWADKPAGAPNLSDQDDQDDVVALAKALVFARTGTASYRTQVISQLKVAVGTERPGDTLGISRNLMPLVLAADLIGWHDPAWTAWLTQLQTWVNPDRSYTLRSIHDKRPNNWGGHAGASRIASDLYLGDSADLAKAVDTFRGFVGDRSAYASFVYGDLSWQANSSAPVGINPKGATKSGTNVDGIIPDDMRRGGSFPTVGTDGVSYTWESLQGWLMQAELLRHEGLPGYGYSDNAVCRATSKINALGHPAEGDDRWQPWLTNPRCAQSAPTTRATTPGKGFGFADWLYGS